MLSNIAAGSDEHIVELLEDSTLIDKILDHMTDADNQVAMESTNVITNMIYSAKDMKIISDFVYPTHEYEDD